MLLSLILLIIFIYGLFYVYMKLTIGICKSSRHLVGKVVIITGGNAGIGYETAKDFAERGARVILACRNEYRGNAAKDRIIKASGNNNVHYRHLDLASLSSVRRFADEISQNQKRLDILVNNAGIHGSYKEITEDGLLLGMQANYFGPFLLTCLLLSLMKSTAPSRIVNVASIAHSRAHLDLDNLNMEKEKISKDQVYAVSKLCNILFTLELSRKLKETGVTSNCLHPGVVDTDILNGIDTKILQFLRPMLKPFFKNQWEGAQTTIYLSVSPDVQDVNGKYFRDCQVVDVSTDQARDSDLARNLWVATEKLLNMSCSDNSD